MIEDATPSSFAQLLRHTEKALGLPLGPLTTALLKLAWDDTESVLLPLVLTAPARSPIYTPKNVILFAHNDSGHEQYAFLEPAASPRNHDPRAPLITTDDLPVCCIDVGAATVVAPNLAGFLSLYALLHLDLADRDRDDEACWRLHEQQIAEDEAEGDDSRRCCARSRASRCRRSPR
jgi:hypothetical protein